MSLTILVVPILLIVLVGWIADAIPALLFAILLALGVRKLLDVIHRRNWWSGQTKDALMVTVGLVATVAGPGLGLLVAALVLVSKALSLS